MPLSRAAVGGVGQARDAAQRHREQSAARARRVDPRNFVDRCATPTTWTIFQQDGPNHLDDAITEHQMALTTSRTAIPAGWTRGRRSS